MAFIYCVLLPWQAIRQELKKKDLVVYTSQQKVKVYFSFCFSFFVMALAIILLWLAFRRPLAAMGFTLTIKGDLWVWSLLAFIVLYSIDGIINVSTPERIAAGRIEWQKRTPFMPTGGKEFPAYLVMCLCAGVFEEIIYRGYLVTYFEYLFKGSDYREILAIVLPAIPFTVAHFYHGAKNMVKIFVLSVLFGLIFIQSGSLVIVMILHFLTNVVGGVISVRYMRERNQ